MTVETVETVEQMQDVDAVVIQFSNLIHQIANNIKRQFPCCEETHGYMYEDLVQFGKIGLLKAIKGFDPSRGLKFMTFAYPNIDGNIRRNLREGHMVKVSRSVVDAFYAIKKQKLEQCQPEELATKIGCSVKTARAAKNYSMHYDSMDKPMTIGGSDDRQVTLGETISSNNTFEDDIGNRDIVNGFFATLTETQQKVWNLRYVTELKQADVAKVIGFSQAHVSRILRDVNNLAKDYGKQLGVYTLA